MSIGVPARAQVPDAGNSYFTPEAGSVATPMVGMNAVHFFWTCPNNDLVSNNARIKVVLRDASDAPIEGVDRMSIYLQFNGGTDKQGFTGDGADSIIANGRSSNFEPPCPLVQNVYADANTDATGTTYITFAGANSSNPGVAVRDPNRKWGHYDSLIPVIADGVLLLGRLTDAGTHGEYVLRIKNVDIKGGLTNGRDHGEAVSSQDYNTFRSSLDEPPDDLSYWRDLNSDGSLNISDINIVTGHMDHNCVYPNNP
ncbi:MAG: hypothetical protein EHM89_18490 [Acidobacteria bacterium]|nr:MAG: hypothetical protein EHM89_18490 [Acidobacteriota bacterium]